MSTATVFNSDQLQHSAQDDERIRLLDAMATMADRVTRTATFRFHIDELRKVLISRLHDGSAATFEVVGQGLYRCGINLPFKAPMYATLAGLLTSASHPFCKPLANGLSDAVVKEFSACLRDGHASTARRALRFLACLANASVVSPVSVAQYVHAVLDAAHFELTSANRSEFGVHCRGDFLAEIGLSVLPWVASTLQTRANEEMVAIAALVDQISDVWRGGLWRCVAPAVDGRCLDSFSQLLRAVAELRANGWRCKYEVIQQPYSVFDVELSCGQEISLPPLAIPGHSKVTFYSAPRFRLVLVNPFPERGYVIAEGEEEGEEEVERKGKGTEEERDGKGKKVGEEGISGGVKGADRAGDGNVHMDGVVLSTPKGQVGAEGFVNVFSQDTLTASAVHTSDGEGCAQAGIRLANVVDIVERPSGTHVEIPVQGRATVEAGDYESIYTVPFSAEGRTPLVTYVIRSYIGDVVDNFSSRHVMAAERLLNLPMLKDVNDEIVECLFSQMCALPSPTFSPVYYGTLFADLCRVKDSRLPAKLLIAVKNMFQHAEELDPEAFDRLAEWFSFHLSNFGYRWNWQEWAVYADQEMVEKFPYRALFCKDVIARCVRLSYYDRIEEILPEEMRVFLPPKPTNGNLARFDMKVNEGLQKIVTGKGRLPWPQVQERLEVLIPVVTDDGGEEDRVLDVAGNLKRLSALMRSILQAGHRTLSHFDIVVERYMDLLRLLSVSGGQPARRLIVTEVKSFWRDVHIRLMYVLDKLAQYSVIDHMSILDSCLTYEKLGTDGMERESLSNGELKVHLAQSSRWEIIRLVMSRARAREEGSRKELALASQNAATANEGEQEEAEKRLEKAKLSTEEAKREIRDLLLEGLRRLFEMTGRLLEDGGVDVEEEGISGGGGSGADGEKMKLPGFQGGPIWYWRCVGMIRELARMHAAHLPYVVTDLDAFTAELREKHRVLWETFDIIHEIEKCSLHTTVW